MKALIVHAHPEPKSFVAALRDTAKTVLTERGYDVSLSDLYADEFNPVTGPDDFQQREDADYLNIALEQRHGHKTGTLAPDIQRELAKVMAADLVVLTFPIYWFSVPAILKGWFDRVLISGPVYGGRRFYARGGLAGKRAVMGVSLGGREHMFGPDGIHGPLDRIFMPLIQGTLGYSGISVLPPFYAFHVPYVDDDARRDMLAAWRNHLSTLEERAPLAMPDLGLFDPQMHPLARPQGA